MKKFIATAFIMILFAAGMTAGAQVDRYDELLGLPGDNLNLYAVMKLFQESETLQDFERNLNDKNSGINNLDLNGDHLVDYITVNDYVDGNVHNIVLQVAINQNESQDVAVFTVQRFDDGSAQIQLVGDEALYGKNYIIEPIYADNNYSGNNVVTPNPGYTGEVVVRTTGLEVAAWPLIRLLFLPGYIVWHSIFGWDNYPGYWNPWRPWYPDYYCGYHSYWDPYYFGHYRHWNEYRYGGYNDFYCNNIRSHSPRVDNMIREGYYRDSHSRPELRREGALNARMNSGRNGKMRNDTYMSSGGRNSGFQSGRIRTGEGTGYGALRQSEATMSARFAMNSPANQGTGVSRRSGGTVSGRMSSSPSAYRSNGISQRSSENITGRSARNSSVQNNISSRRSAGTVSGRMSSSPSAYRSSGISQRSSVNMNARSARNSSIQSSGSSHRSASSFSGRSSSKQRSAPVMKSARSTSGRSASSIHSGGGSRGGGRSGSVMARGNSGGHSSSNRSGRR